MATQQEEKRICKNCATEFSIAPDDFSFYEKVGVPTPTFCPDCRFQRRLLWRNERTFYRRACGLCKRSVIAVYPTDAPFPVYCQKCWWSDKWSALSYGQDVDFSRPFMDQVEELHLKVPMLSIQNDDGVGSTNSEYAYDWAFSKNVYLSACGWYTENCLYSYHACYDKDIMDSYFVSNSELVYELVSGDKCFGMKFCRLCFDSTNCALSYDLKGCSNCILCVGLRNKQHHIRNQPYSKEEYEKEVEKLQLGRRESLEKFKSELRKLILQRPHKYSYQLKTVNCTGDALERSKNSHACFYAVEIENCRHVIMVDEAKDCYDCNNTGRPELCYDSITPDNSRGNKFSVFCWKCTEAEYSNNCHSCVSVFGCSGLKHTSYAILNKQYDKESFGKLRIKLIEHMKKTGEWGEFFPHTLSPHAYNETAALEWFPLTKDEALKKGYRWKDEVKKEHVPTKTAADLPQTIAEVDDSIVNEVIACAHAAPATAGCTEKCTEAFKIVPAELQLYRKLDIPLPTLCPNCRHYARLAIRNPAKLWHRRCQCSAGTSDPSASSGQARQATYKNTASHSHGEKPCPNEFETSFAPERPEIVYCEACYNAEIA